MHPFRGMPIDLCANEPAAAAAFASTRLGLRGRAGRRARADFSEAPKMTPAAPRPLGTRRWAREIAAAAAARERPPPNPSAILSRLDTKYCDAASSWLACAPAAHIARRRRRRRRHRRRRTRESPRAGQVKLGASRAAEQSEGVARRQVASVGRFVRAEPRRPA